jgi:hypothetical protein
MKVALVALTTSALFALLAPASATQSLIEFKIDSRLQFEDSGNPNFSQIALTFQVKCAPSQGTLQVDGFIEQPQAPSGFGFTTVTCTGRTEKAVAHVQSNFGTLYIPGPAKATVTTFVNGISRTVTLVS